jgi:hypothetical protein
MKRAALIVGIDQHEAPGIRSLIHSGRARLKERLLPYLRTGAWPRRLAGSATPGSLLAKNGRNGYHAATHDDRICLRNQAADGRDRGGLLHHLSD